MPSTGGQAAAELQHRDSAQLSPTIEEIQRCVGCLRVPRRGARLRPSPSGKDRAIDYARGRLGSSAGEVHVHDESGENVVETITIDDRIKYSHAV